MSSKRVLLVVVSLLTVAGAVVSSSILEAHALQPDPNYFTADDCSEVGPHSAPLARCCWDEYDDTGKLKVTFCQICGYNSPTTGPSWACLAPPSVQRPTSGGNTHGPLNLTNAQNAPVNPPGGKITGPLNLTNAQSGPINLPGGKNTGPPSNTNAPPTPNATNHNLTGTNGLHYPGVQVTGPLNNANSASVHHHHKSTSSSPSNTNGTGH